MVGGKSTVEIIIAAKDHTKAAFAKVNTQMKTMKGGTGRLTGAMNGLKGGLSNVTSSLGSFGAAMGPVGIAVAGAAIVMATLGGAAFKASLEFEKAVATIRVGTGATGEALAGLEGSFKTVFTAVPTTTANASTAIADLNTRLGLTGEPLESLATQFLNLSRITGTDVAASISSATRVMHDFDVSTEEQAGALDYLFKVSQSTGLGMTQLGNSMTQYGSVMRQMGFDINESAALLGKFEKEGVNLQLVLGSLRMGLANFAKAGEEPVEALSRVITEIQSMGSVADANMKAIEIFGSRAGPDMAAAIREGRFSIEELMASLDASGETINKAAADTLQFGDKWTLLKNNITEAIAPIGDVITNALGNAIEGLSKAFDGLQSIVGPAMDVIFIKFNMLRSFLEGLFTPILAAFAPLKGSFDGLSGSVSRLNILFSLISDVTTILTGAAKMLGTAIGNLVAMAITPLVAKLQEAGGMLDAFYEKLGPLKGVIEGIKSVAGGVVEGVSNMADSFKEAVPPIEEVEEALKTLAEEGPTAPKAVADAWAMAIKDFQDGAGTYKDAIGGIEEKIADLTEEWMTATDKRKDAIDKEMDVLEAEKDTLEDLKKTAEGHFTSTVKHTEEATKKMEEFTVSIGDTTISFKGAAAEVIKNADAYEKLQDSAQKIMDLDWSVFSEFEASLPNIEAGIGNMESSFVGLKDVLEDNIGELENVKQSVMDISEIAQPFLEAGFLNGIKSIGSFAGSLKDAGAAIDTFSSLQDVSIEGCINFSLHVHDMVSALEILEDQMEDLVPSFAKMDSLITDIADAFLYSGGRGKETQDIISSTVKNAITDLESQGVSVDGLISKYNEYIVKGLSSNDALARSFLDLGVSSREGFFNFYELLDSLAGTNVGYDMADEFIAALEAGEDLDEWGNKYIHTSGVITHQMDVQTNALKAQTEQLSKITDALQPYLEFMRTLNELAALSTLSTEKLNNGLKAINDTLSNLGTALSTFDLRPVMEALFGTIVEVEGKVDEYSGGAATSFTDTMKAYETPLNNMIVYVTRLTNAITGLTSAFDSLANISGSVLADQTKLGEVFEGIVTVLSNFSIEMGGTEGFAQKFADGMDAMLKSAEPLIIYFQDNNAAIEQFNSTLNTFNSAITNVVDTMSMLKEMSEMVLPSITELEAGFERVEEAVSRFQEAMLKHIGIDISAGIFDEEKFKKNIFTSITNFAADWNEAIKGMDTDFETFEKATGTITKLISGIQSLSNTFTTFKDNTIPSSTDMEVAFRKISDAIIELWVALDSEEWSDVVTSLDILKTKWDEISEGVEESLKSFSNGVTIFADIVDATKRLTDTFTDMEEIVEITADQIETAFEDIIPNIDAVTEYLTRKSFADLKSALKDVHTEWQKYTVEMEKSMESFNATIDTFSTLISKVLSLSTALQELKEMSVLSVRDISEAMKKIPLFLDNFVDALALNMYAIKESLKDLDKEWSKHAEEMKATMPAYEDATDAISKLISPILSLNSALEQLAEMGTISGAEFDRGFSSLMSSITNFATSLSKNVDDLIDSLLKLSYVWDENKATLAPLMDTFMVVTYSFWEIANNANAMAEAFRDLQKNSGSLEKGFKSLIDFITQVVKSTKEFYTPEAAAELATYITDVGKVIDSFVDLEVELKGAMDKIESAIGSAVDNIEGKLSSLSNLVNSAYYWGVNIMGAFITGIDSMSNALESAVAQQATIVDDYLGASSPTKLGPLSHLEEWPKNLIQSYSSGLEAEMRTLNASFAGLAPGMMAAPMTAPMTGGNKNVNFYVTQNIGSHADADYSTDQLRRMITRQEVM